MLKKIVINYKVLFVLYLLLNSCKIKNQNFSIEEHFKKTIIKSSTTIYFDVLENENAVVEIANFYIEKFNEKYKYNLDKSYDYKYNDLKNKIIHVIIFKKFKYIEDGFEKNRIIEFNLYISKRDGALLFYNDNIKI